MTRPPIRSPSALTLRIQRGRSRSPLRPDSDSVLIMTYRATAGPPQAHGLARRSEVYHALSVPDALRERRRRAWRHTPFAAATGSGPGPVAAAKGVCRHARRSERHTAELQSRSDLVFRLL